MGSGFVWRPDIAEKAEASHKNLLGHKPAILDKMLVRWVGNRWIATYTWELEITLSLPIDLKEKKHILTKF